MSVVEFIPKINNLPGMDEKFTPNNLDEEKLQEFMKKLDYVKIFENFIRHEQRRFRSHYVIPDETAVNVFSLGWTKRAEKVDRFNVMHAELIFASNIQLIPNVDKMYKRKTKMLVYYDPNYMDSLIKAKASSKDFLHGASLLSDSVAIRKNDKNVLLETAEHGAGIGRIIRTIMEVRPNVGVNFIGTKTEYFSTDDYKLGSRTSVKV